MRDAPVAAAPGAAAEPPEAESYDRIVASTALMAASTLATVGFGIVRAKLVALWLGPAGVGLLGAFGAVADLGRGVAELGVNSSGVRQIADAAGAGDAARLARTAAVLRRVSLALACVGAVLLAAFAGPIAVLTFGDAGHAAAVAALGAVVACRLVADARCALLQGLRRIGDLARVNIAAAAGGTLAAVPLIFVWRERGVVPALVAAAVASLVAAGWYARKAGVAAVRVAPAELRRETAALLRLGLAFLASAMLVSGVAYATRVLVVRDLGLDAAGRYQAAWTLGGLYVGFVLQAMSADFYPRLVGVVEERARCSRVVNEQARASLLMAGPGVLATMSFAPLLLALLYSASFEAAAPTLRWLCLGMALRVLTWPMGFIIVAKGSQALFMATELAWAVSNVALAWLLLDRFGLAGVGIAFAASYVLHGALVYAVVRRIAGFRWTAGNLRLGAATLALCVAVLGAFAMLPPGWAAALAAAALCGSAFYSARELGGLLPAERCPPALRRLLQLRTEPSR